MKDILTMPVVAELIRTVTNHIIRRLRGQAPFDVTAELRVPTPIKNS